MVAMVADRGHPWARLGGSLRSLCLCRALATGRYWTLAAGQCGGDTGGWGGACFEQTNPPLEAEISSRLLNVW